MRQRKEFYQFGDFRIQLQLPLDLDKIADVGEEARHAGISKEAFPLFGIVWASSEVMAHLLLVEDIAGKRILEIGCGMALSSHLLNAMGADITAMDIHPMTEQLLIGNCANNDAELIPFQTASWGEELPDLGEFDLIIGSDILYEPKHVNTLAPFLDRHTKASAEVIIVDPDRGLSDAFNVEMVGFGFNCNSEIPTFFDHLEVPYAGKVFRYQR
jgi:predicted nicotinamide N-methyase